MSESEYPPPNNHRRFLDQEMTLRRTSADSDNDYIVKITGLAAARIHQVKLAGSVTTWSWSVAGPSLPHELYPHGGMAENLDEAESIVRQKFNGWLAWAIERERAVYGMRQTRRLPEFNFSSETGNFSISGTLILRTVTCF